MFKTLILLLALNPSELTYRELEKYYWDCDTLFMKNEMGGPDVWSCLAITDEFQSYFESKEDFMIYWHEHRIRQWNSRGYYPKAEIY